MKELKILYLEDSPHDAEIAGYVLKSAGIDFTLKLVDTQEEYQEALEKYQPDIILADHSLFHFNSSEALRIFKSTDLNIPFILVTGTVSEEFAVNILKEGADDYLLKNNLARLPNAILNSLEKYRLERERKEYMNNVIANEALMREAEGLALFGSWEVDVVTGGFKWSDEVYRIYGYEPGEVKPGQDIVLHHIHPEDRPVYQQALFSLLKEQDNYASEIRIIDKNNRHKFISFRIVVKRNDEGQLTRLIGFMQDITQKKELEKELAVQALYQQRLITEVTIQAQEKERNELGKELHDNINQVLATIKMFLGMSLENQEKRDELIKKCINNTNYAIEEIRKLSKSLVAPSLGDIGLVEALTDLIHDLNVDTEPGLELIAELDDKTNINKDVELMLYRIAQEQLNNIRKYAKAKNVVITINTKGENLLFSIADDGVGFNPSQKAYGIGLKNISSRVDFYDGTLNIISSPGEGCKLEISIPIQKTIRI